MADLASYYTVNRKEMERFVSIGVGYYTQYIDRMKLQPSPPYDFHKLYWAEVARQTRGLPLIYDNFNTFWEEFKAWFNLRSYNYNKMLIVAHTHYEPLHNYDRTEEHTENVGKSGKRQTSGKERNQTTQNGRSNSTTKHDATTKGENVTNNSVNGYNGEEMTVRDSSVTIRNDSDTASTEGTTRMDSATDGYRNVDSTEVDKEEQTTKRAIRAYGNIGVTTSQQMLESEIALRRTHVINHMVADFKRDFCIMVY